LNTKDFWERKLASKGDFWRDAHYFELLDYLPKNRNFSLFDLGCAIGDGPNLLKRTISGAEITGADISEIAIDKAKKKNDGNRYIVFDVLKDKISEKYDFITIIETLEHFDDPFFIVDKCLMSCKESVFVSTPYTQNYSGKIDFVDEHRYAFNERTFEKYNSRVLKITDFMKETGGRCIIYEIKCADRDNT
jgi:2-polyprenyl-3-methyl-5-hydroxy-6-metoxy-1,4-benzoquinol methylase